MRRLIITTVLLTLCCLPLAAQLNGSGFYRLRNYQNKSHYISLANNLFNYHTIIADAGGGAKHMFNVSFFGQLADDYGVPAAMTCVRQYLATDIKIVEDDDCVDPSTIVYLKRNGSSNQYDLMGQSTNLLGLTTGMYETSKIKIEFKNLYATIQQNGKDGDNNLYTATIDLKGTGTAMGFISETVTLETDYFYDNNGTFNIKEKTNAGVSNDSKWYIEPVTQINVKADAAWTGEDKVRRYYTTYFVPFAYTLGGNITNAYVVTGINNDGVIEKTSIAANGQEVPAGTPVILECLSNVPSENYIIPKAEEPIVGGSIENGTADVRTTTNYTGTNLLKGAYFCNTDGELKFDHYTGGETVGTKKETVTNGASFVADNYVSSSVPSSVSKYVLGFTESGFLGMVKAEENTPMPANKAWLEYNGSASSYPLFTNVQSLRGDVNRDGTVDVRDVTATVNIIQKRDPDFDYDYDAADMNANGVIDVIDVTAIINLIQGRE